MTALLRELNERPIAYFPIYRKLTGSTTAGLLLSQLMFWFNKKDKFYKTDADIIDETMLTINELRTAKNLIKKLDFITVSVEGIPAKTYYKIDWKAYQTTLVELTEPSSLNPQTTDSEIHETNTNTTTKTSLIEEEEEVVSFSNQTSFIDYLRLEYKYIPVDVKGCKYHFGSDGKLKDDVTKVNIAFGLAKSIFAILFNNKAIMLKYFKEQKGL